MIEDKIVLLSAPNNVTFFASIGIDKVTRQRCVDWIFARKKGVPDPLSVSANRFITFELRESMIVTCDLLYNIALLSFPEPRVLI